MTVGVFSAAGAVALFAAAIAAAAATIKKFTPQGEIKGVRQVSEAAGDVLDFAWPGGAAPLVITHDGRRRPWVTVSSRAAIPLRQALSSG